MVTLLLTFFVMLLSLAEAQDAALFSKGRDSFIDSIRYIGLGVLFGRKDTSDLGTVKLKYYTSEPDDSSARRSIDANQEKARRLFQRLTQFMTAIPSQIVAEKTNFVLANIHFPSGQAALSEAAKKYLTEFCLDLQQDRGSDAIKLYVLGLCDDESTEEQQWILSAKRALAVAGFLQAKFSSSSNWPVYSWGAGSGGEWRGRNSPISKDSHILIAVLRNGE
jgi:outer membrane protein OmpA-like peptidoglycan-associated protein